ncbi:BMP family protein [Mesorhizobium sp.]|uniref:BMP family protein n=1 Tax=Mesorhizobium sp. TaxID=1871066 RepID=UPI000FE4DA5C|nr:BMP family protein [Mesorhizobium sp.]RWE68324.1 MAG: BMP family ABC transporter substrate-binding protein [Mesorhizobium sp.]RWE92034.1 MAG: BMP family ABC transporter substrate-binding protein [Mesorhizobium sp.]RWF56140.1 MAG: BMP family ABC transporter substrate-binding protein [Mesorhizobium sp.]
MENGKSKVQSKSEGLSRRSVLELGALGLAATMLPGLALAQDKKLKVAAIFATPTEEPWVHQIHVALQRAEKELGIEYKWSEKVQTADFSRVMREYAQGGYELVLGDAFAAERESRRTAKQFPKVAFLFGSGAGPAEPNFAVFDNWIHEPAYLSGLIAGKMSKSGTIGAVAAMGIPEVNRLVNAFFAGAREVNPDIKRKVAFIGSFFDPPKAKEAAIAQIDAGVDVIYAERFGVIEAAVERKILAISNMSDQSNLGPDTVITGPVWDMYPTVEHAIKLVKAGVFTAQDYGDFSRMAKGGSFLAPYHKFDKTLPADVKELVEKKKAEILDGNFRVDVDENTPVSD